MVKLPAALVVAAFCLVLASSASLVDAQQDEGSCDLHSEGRAPPDADSVANLQLLRRKQAAEKAQRTGDALEAAAPSISQDEAAEESEMKAQWWQAYKDRTANLTSGAAAAIDESIGRLKAEAERQRRASAGKRGELRELNAAAGAAEAEAGTEEEAEARAGAEAAEAARAPESSDGTAGGRAPASGAAEDGAEAKAAAVARAAEAPGLSGSTADIVAYADQALRDAARAEAGARDGVEAAEAAQAPDLGGSAAGGRAPASRMAEDGAEATADSARAKAEAARAESPGLNGSTAALIAYVDEVLRDAAQAESEVPESLAGAPEGPPAAAGEPPKAGRLKDALLRLAREVENS